MVDYYASTSVADGTVAAGTELDPTSIRHAYGVLADTPGDRVLFKDDGAPWTLEVSQGSLTAAVAGTAGFPIQVIGYTTTVGDGGLPEIAASDNTIDEIILADDSYTQWSNLVLTGGRRAVQNDMSGTRGVSFNRVWMRDQTVACVDTAGHTNEPFAFLNCLFENAPIGLEVGGRDALVIACGAINCPTAGFQVANNNKGAKLVRCFAHACGTGFQLGANEAWLDHCVANQCTDGVTIGGSGRYVLSNTGIANCTRGITAAGGTLVQLWHCGSWNNTTLLSGGVNPQHVFSLVTGNPNLARPAPLDPLDVDLRLGPGSAWLAAGMGSSDYLPNMAATDIGIPGTATPGSSVEVAVQRFVPLRRPQRGR